jgi:hypothetical protein
VAKHSHRDQGVTSSWSAGLSLLLPQQPTSLSTSRWCQHYPLANRRWRGSIQALRWGCDCRQVLRKEPHALLQRICPSCIHCRVLLVAAHSKAVLRAWVQNELSKTCRTGQGSVRGMAARKGEQQIAGVAWGWRLHRPARCDRTSQAGHSAARTWLTIAPFPDPCKNKKNKKTYTAGLPARHMGVQQKRGFTRTRRFVFQQLLHCCACLLREVCIPLSTNEQYGSADVLDLIRQLQQQHQQQWHHHASAPG